MADPKFAALIENLPFTRGDRVVIVGDSITAVATSWANILGVILQHRGIELINRAVSGRSSTETIAVFDKTLALNPDWIVLMIGANDVRRHGAVAGVRLLSLDESIRNIKELCRMASEESHARVVVIPSHPPIDPSKVEENRSAGTFWLVEEVESARQAVVAAVPDAFDVMTHLTVDSSYWGPDGVHPTAAGQRKLLRSIANGLTSTSPHPSNQ
nr:SGNH/GDSL hydrolase family protein [Psychromicrobium silvestre]